MGLLCFQHFGDPVDNRAIEEERGEEVVLLGGSSGQEEAEKRVIGEVQVD